MAEKKRKSQAEKAASSKSKKTTAKKKAPKQETAEKAVVKERVLPTRFITSAVFLALFVVLLVIYLSPEGVLNRLFENVVLGLFGWVGYIVSIPALLYLFVIHAFSNKRPVMMRSVCVGSFVLLCGCIAHLAQETRGLEGGLELIKDLYIGGSNGSTGGVICGGIAMLFRWLCGTALSYILFVVGAAFTLLGAMQITIPSIVRAVKNRPRAEWEDEELEPQPEPAAIVVNHIANKRIAYVEQRRNRELQEYGESEQIPNKPQRAKKRESKVSDMMRQIETDIESPVSVAGVPVKNVTEDEIIAPATESAEPEIISEAMPEFDPTAPIPPAPKRATPHTPARFAATPTPQTRPPQPVTDTRTMPALSARRQSPLTPRQISALQIPPTVPNFPPQSRFGYRTALQLPTRRQARRATLRTIRIPCASIRDLRLPSSSPV